jgi:tetratricopeptide (TPR) repeat protein
MLELKMRHLDDFTLLRYLAEDLEDAERGEAAEHLGACSTCQATLREIDGLDKELIALAKDPAARQVWEIEDLPAEDPFRRRPIGRRIARLNRIDAADVAARAVVASEEGTALSTVILDAARKSARDLQDLLSRLSLSDPADRFALLYALQEAGRQIAENPVRFLALAECSLSHLREFAHCQDSNAGAEQAVPMMALFGQTHQLAGQGCLWTGDLEKSGSHLELAYRAFALGGRDETSLARVELVESQRRFFAEKGAEALVLARRASTTFELFGLEDEQARCQVAEGMALFQLGSWEDAVGSFREALPVFENRGLWSNYVGTLNTIGHCLVKLGRLAEARREYARALRRLSRERHRSWLPFIRKGLADVLFSGRRYREAAIAAGQAARLYAEDGQVSRALVAGLFEVESWARAGDLTRARHRLDLFSTEVSRQGVLDPTLKRLIGEALSGASPDFQKIAELRQCTEETLNERFGQMRA